MAMGAHGLSRRTVLMRVVLLMIVVFAGIGYLIPDVHQSLKSLTIVPSLSRLCPTPPSPPPPPTNQRPAVVNGLPTKRCRDNLRNDTYYITGWASAGFTNAFMNFANMIYLGKLSDRVPIVPPFAPAAHISKSAGIIPFGDIFDLDLLRKELNMDILEWRDVKDLPSRYSTDPYATAEVDEIGCWTTTKESSNWPAPATNTVQHIGLDISYTKIPNFARMPDYEPFVMFPELAALVYPRDPYIDPTKTKALTKTSKGQSLTPDLQLVCFDSLYYIASGVRAYEWERSWSPGWNMVGKNLHFTQTMENLAHSYMVKAFGLTGNDDIPKFIAIHIRHGDFHGQCKPHSHTEVQDGNDCFPPLSSYGHSVDEIKEELLAKHNLSISSVIVMSDETSDAFWSDVKAQGWVFVNHTAEATVEKYGEWYAPLLDTIIQSHAMGFVGTKSSTFSLVGERRVQDWHGGVYRDVSIRDGH